MAVPFSSLALIDTIGGPELVLIFALIALFFGAKRLPELGRSLGSSLREFKKATRVDDEPPPPANSE